MPELPEVETVARTLAPHIINKRICAIHVLNAQTWQGSILASDVVTPHKQPYIQATGRRGKLLLIHLKYPQEENIHNENQESKADKESKADEKNNVDKDSKKNKETKKNKEHNENQVFALAFHLKMTGRIFPYAQLTKPTKHTRIILDLNDGTRIFFDDVRKFGYVRALTKKNIMLWDFWKNLGPEPLEIKKSEFIPLFQGRNASIKSLLLNQQVLAGIGNIYADECLFKADIHPQQKASNLSVLELEKLYHSIIEVLEESIRFCGSSIRDYRTANGDVGSFQNKFYVYNRAGQECKICNNIIAKISVAGRTTNFCPYCQAF